MSEVSTPGKEDDCRDAGGRATQAAVAEVELRQEQRPSCRSSDRVVEMWRSGRLLMATSASIGALLFLLAFLDYTGRVALGHVLVIAALRNTLKRSAA